MESATGGKKGRKKARRIPPLSRRGGKKWLLFLIHKKGLLHRQFAEEEK